MSVLEIEEEIAGGGRSYSSFIIEDGIVYAAGHGYKEEEVGKVDEDGNIKMVLKLI